MDEIERFDTECDDAIEETIRCLKAGNILAARRSDTRFGELLVRLGQAAKRS